MENKEENPKISKSLEKVIALAFGVFQSNDDSSIFNRYGSYPPDIFRDHTDPVSGVKVLWVSSYNLPSGDGWRALGVYDSSTNTMSMDKDYHERHFVYKHELGHARGITDERIADDYALAA